MPTSFDPLPSPLVETLIPEPNDAVATHVVLGVNWTLVGTETGAGIVHTPAKSQQGCAPVSDAGNFIGRPLDELINLISNDNPLARAIGFAAMNAYWGRFDTVGIEANGFDFVDDSSALKTVVVGRFPKLAQRLPHAAVIERNPGPGDYPPEAAGRLLPAADQIVITGSTLSNGSLDNLLALRSDATVFLIGPSTPLCSDLFKHRIDVLSGFVVTDVERAAQSIGQGGGEKALKAVGRQVTIRTS